MFIVVKFIFESICYQRNENLQKEHTLDILLDMIHPIFTRFKMQVEINLLRLKMSFLTRIHAMILQILI